MSLTDEGDCCAEATGTAKKKHNPDKQISHLELRANLPRPI